MRIPNCGKMIWELAVFGEKDIYERWWTCLVSFKIPSWLFRLLFKRWRPGRKPFWWRSSQLSIPNGWKARYQRSMSNVWFFFCVRLVHLSLYPYFYATLFRISYTSFQSLRMFLLSFRLCQNRWTHRNAVYWANIDQQLIIPPFWLNSLPQHAQRFILNSWSLT